MTTGRPARDKEFTKLTVVFFIIYRLQSRAPVAPEKVSLPALRPNINSVVADRRRRQQAILRGRMGRKDFY